MPIVTCPCCRASNDAGPNCRRCSADLSLLFKLEADRDSLLAEAGQLLASERAAESLPVIAKAESLRPGEEIHRLRAVANLLNRDYDGALRGHRLATRSI